MNLSAMDLLWAIVRSTAFLSVAAVAALLAFRDARVFASRARAVVWTLVLLQGWLVIPLSITLPDYRRPTPDARRNAITHASDIGHSASESHAGRWRPRLDRAGRHRRCDRTLHVRGSTVGQVPVVDDSIRRSGCLVRHLIGRRRS